VVIVFQVPPVVAGTVLIVSDIRSQNYAAGTTGWIIEADGDAEFNDLLARGVISTGVSPDAHIEISTAFANTIRMFTGNADETSPAEIAVVSADANSGYIQIGAPDLAGDTETPPYLQLTSRIVGSNHAILDADDIYLQTPSQLFTFDQFLTIGSGWRTVGAVGQPAFTNSWTGIGSRSPRFKLYPDGDVQIEGSFANGTAANAAIFTLPVGYRPPATLASGDAVTSAGGSVRVVVTSAGVVNFSNGGSTAQTDVLLRFSTLTA
jgi:hypothetical protein